MPRSSSTSRSHLRAVETPAASEISTTATGPSSNQEWTDELLLLVHRQMRTLAGPHPDLDDLVQTAIEQILRAEFQGRSKWSTFTHGVCYRVWLKHLRFTYQLRARFRFGDDEESDPPAPHLSAADALQTRERYTRLYAALEKVSKKRRAVVALADIAELDIDTIAEIVDANPLTVRSRLRDGRKRLAQLLHEDPYFGDEALQGGRTNG